MPYIYSTLSNDQNYAKYPPKIDPKAITQPIKTFFIAGRANILDEKFNTPKGIVTKVSQADLDILRTIKQFNFHVEAGYLVIDEGNKELDPDQVAKGMTPKDSSAQLDDSDFEEKKKPKVNK